MTTVELPNTSTYTTIELVSCLVEPSACAYPSKVRWRQIGPSAAADGLGPKRRYLPRSGKTQKYSTLVLLILPSLCRQPPWIGANNGELSQMRIRRWRACTSKSEPSRTGLQSPCKRAVVSSILTGGSTKSQFTGGADQRPASNGRSGLTTRVPGSLGGGHEGAAPKFSGASYRESHANVTEST